MSRRLLSAAVLAAVLTLAGCAPAPDLAADAAGRLQQQVLAVSTASAGGRLDEALAGLDQTEKELDAALAAEEISPKRYREVREAIRLVRADLDAAVAAAAQAQADAAAAAEAQRQAELAQQLADQQAAEEAAAEDPGPGQGGPDPGNGKDKGKDGGKGKGKDR
ncbi:hypothetical protein [Naasia aerilata]|uniref:Mucin-associated surface protein n=1 Tax=Naasia aerilata TaxID=1162966 RepID=A0ABN6XKN7_9MICO|nr:hypothetical protein [Naasia aerilata]BDZ44161.1 hypothetical protein GCM10025866_00700 [Naasia aerilata]